MRYDDKCMNKHTNLCQLTSAELAEIQRLNEWPHREVGFCLRCGEYYTLVQLRLPASKEYSNASPR